MTGTIYNGDYQTLLHTKYRSSGPFGFREEDFFSFSHCKSMETIYPRGVAKFDLRGMAGTEDHWPLPHTKYQRTIGPENAHLKPDLGVLSHNEMTLTLNTHTPLLTS